MFRKTSREHIFTDYEKGALEFLIDGEGSLMITKKLQPIIEITNTSKILLVKAQAIIEEDDTIIATRPQPPDLKRPERHKTCFCLRIMSRNYVKNILTQISLTAKAEQQRVLLDAIKLLDEKPDGYVFQVQAIRDKLHILNMRGKRDGL